MTIIPDSCLLASEAALCDWAISFAKTLVAPVRIGLSGPLGAGKTTLARTMIRHLANDPALVVPSPTFTLAQTYDTPRGLVHHLDLYRLNDPDELIDIGWDDLCGAIMLIEWPDKGGNHIALHAHIHLMPVDGSPDARRLWIEKPGLP